MKTVLLFLVCALITQLASGANEAGSLRQVLDKSITPGEVREDWLSENLKSWTGLKNINGVAALFDLRLNTNDGHELLACAYIEKQIEVPKPEIAFFLMNRAKVITTDTYLLMRYLDCMEPYSDDPRVTKYYASLLPDKRPLNRNRHPVEGGHTVRVCDVALKNLVKRLEKQNLLKWGDPGFVWDALHSEDFENNIVAIQPYLVKTGVIDSSTVAKLHSDVDPKELSALPIGETQTVPQTHQSAVPQPESKLWLIWWLILSVATFGAVWLLLHKRK